MCTRTLQTSTLHMNTMHACDPHQIYLKHVVHMYLNRDSSTFMRQTESDIVEKAEIWRKLF
jgi:hypothetical protein